MPFIFADRFPELKIPNHYMSEELYLLRKYPDEQQALELKQLLAASGIEAHITEDSFIVDIATFTSSQTNKEFLVKIAGTDYEAADALLHKMALEELPLIPKDYLLYDFDEDDLKDIIQNPQEWSKTDYLLAIRILEERHIQPEAIQQVITQAETERKTAKDGGILIPCGYVLSLAGGYPGLLTGIILYSTKRPLFNGQRVYLYNEHSRKHGLYITCISAVTSLLVTGWQIYTLSR